MPAFDAPSRRAAPVPHFHSGCLCAEAQADGVPCTSLDIACEECARARAAAEWAAATAAGCAAAMTVSVGGGRA